MCRSTEIVPDISVSFDIPSFSDMRRKREGEKWEGEEEEEEQQQQQQQQKKGSKKKFLI